MAVLRLSNGADISTQLDVAGTLSALEGSDDDTFVELPADDGRRIHIRPTSVIAVLDGESRTVRGFRP